VPGVALVDWAIRCGRDAFAIELPVVRALATTIQVSNPAPGGGTSNGVNMPLSNPTPAISGLSR
jgi:hypothetical protein